MLTDWELWAVANKVLEQHGEDVGAFLQERIETLGEAGDLDGVETWLAVAQRILAMQGPAEGEGVN